MSRLFATVSDWVLQSNLQVVVVPFYLLAMMQVLMLYMVNEIVGKNCGFGTNPFDLSGRQGWLVGWGGSVGLVGVWKMKNGTWTMGEKFR